MAANVLVNLEPPSEQAIHASLVAAHRGYDYYQNVGPILLKLNPYPQFSFEPDQLALMKKIIKPSADDQLPPSHIYRFAETIRRAALGGSGSQAVIFRGMNGSGKSEALKACIHYLVYSECYATQPGRGDVDFSKPLGLSVHPFAICADSSLVCRKLVASICLISAFTTAATDKNNFSSRALKFVSLRYGGAGKLTAVRVRAVFNELLRTSTKEPAQSPLLIQALLIKGSGKAQELGLNSSLVDTYSNSGFNTIDLVAEFAHLQELLLSAGLKASDWHDALKGVAAVCMLQGVTFIGTDTTLVSSSTKNYITLAEGLLGVEAQSISTMLMKKADDRLGRPAGSTTETKPAEAKAILDAACALIISKAMTHLLDALAVAMPMDPTGQEGVVHLIDPIGWDRLGIAQVGGFAHLVNHYIEERLNQQIIQRVFKEEFDKYEAEGVQLEAVALPDWLQHQELLDKPMTGIMAILDDTCMALRGEDKVFVDTVFKGLAAKTKLVKAGGARAKPTSFSIKHSFADVTYDCEGFITVHKCGHAPPAAVALFKTSSLPFLAGADIGYDSLPLPKDESRFSIVRVKTESRAPSTPSFFWNRSKDIYNRLQADLNACSQRSFVVCIGLTVPSLTSDANNEIVMNQIRSCALENLILVSQRGFSYVKGFIEFYNKFRFLAPFASKQLPLSLTDSTSPVTGKALCQSLLAAAVARLEIPSDLPNWLSHAVYGNTNIFVKEKLAVLLEDRRFKIFEHQQHAIIIMQAIVRMFLSRRRFVILKHGTIALQSMSRKRACRGKFLITKRAAILIKSILRMIIQRRIYNTMKNAVNVIKHRLLGKMIQRIRYKKLIRAARAFQTIARGFNVRKSAQHVYSAVLLLQRKCRAFVKRRRIIAKRIASANKIQNIFRGYHSRCQHYNIVRVLRVRREQRIAERVVRTLQALWRGRMVVNRFQSIFNSTMFLQSWLRNRIQRRRYLKIRNLVLWLQSHARRMTAFKFANTLKVGQMLASEKGALAAIFAQEVAVLNDKRLSDCVIATGLQRQGKSRFERNLLAYDLYFDLSFAYPDGWLHTLLSFYKDLKNKQNRSLVKVSVGSQHTVLVDDKWDVYTFGLGDVGQLGHSNRTSSSQPRLIELLQQIISTSDNIPSRTVSSKTEVKDIACGKDHTLLLTATGRVYSWGDNRRGQLGHSNFDVISTPRLVSSGDNKPLKHVNQIGCGAYHSACLADPGMLYTWGAGDCLGRVIESVMPSRKEEGVVGNELFFRRTIYSKQYRPYDGSADIIDCCEAGGLPFFIRKKIHQMVCGESHITVQCGDSLYAWGRNGYGQLGTGLRRDERLPCKLAFRPLAESELHHLQLLSGGRHMMLLSKGRMWLWGWNKYGQIGDGSVESVYKPLRVQIRGLGQEQGQGHGDKKPSTPKAVQAPALRKLGEHQSKTIAKVQQLPVDQAMGDSYIRSAVLGQRHTIVLTAFGLVYGWGVVNHLLRGAAAEEEEQRGAAFAVYLVPTKVHDSGPSAVQLIGASGASMSFAALDHDTAEEVAAATAEEVHKMSAATVKRLATRTTPEAVPAATTTVTQRGSARMASTTSVEKRGGGGGVYMSTAAHGLLQKTSTSSVVSEAALISERFRRELRTSSGVRAKHAATTSVVRAPSPYHRTSTSSVVASEVVNKVVPAAAAAALPRVCRELPEDCLLHLFAPRYDHSVRLRAHTPEEVQQTAAPANSTSSGVPLRSPPRSTSSTAKVVQRGAGRGTKGSVPPSAPTSSLTPLSLTMPSSTSSGVQRKGGKSLGPATSSVVAAESSVFQEQMKDLGLLRAPPGGLGLGLGLGFPPGDTSSVRSRMAVGGAPLASPSGPGSGTGTGDPLDRLKSDLLRMRAF